MQKVSRVDLPLLVKEILGTVEVHNDRAAIIALSGELGAGKTTFVQALAQELGVTDTVQSPTYVLMKKYDISNNKILPNLHTLVHLDLYRLGNSKEFNALKPEQFLHDPHVLVCVEWPERVGEALPKADLNIKFSSDGAGEGERFINIEK